MDPLDVQSGEPLLHPEVWATHPCWSLSFNQVVPYSYPIRKYSTLKWVKLCQIGQEISTHNALNRRGILLTYGTEVRESFTSEIVGILQNILQVLLIIWSSHRRSTVNITFPELVKSRFKPINLILTISGLQKHLYYTINPYHWP